MSSSLPPGINLCEIPALKPPDGEVPNFVDPTTLAPATWTICLVLTIFSVSLVVLRLWMNIRKLDVADYFMAMGGVMTITYTGLIISLSRYNRHQWDIPACWLDERYLKIIFAGTTIVGAVLFFPKCSIFFMYRKMFPKTSMEIGTWIGFIFTFCIYFPSIPLSAIYEAPKPGHTWDELLQHLASSTDHTLVYWGIVQGACSVLLDLYIFTLPIPTLFRLRLPLEKRLQLFALFATALMGVIASVVALVFRVDLLHNPDSTWNQARLAICVVTENNVAIAVGSMPVVAKFVKSHIAGSTIFQSLRSKLWGSSDRSESYAMTPNVPGGSDNRKPHTWIHPQADEYYELTESRLMQTQVTTADQEESFPAAAPESGAPGASRNAINIVRTVSITQQGKPGNRSQSLEQLL